MPYNFPSEVEYMPLRSEIRKAEHAKMARESLLGGLFLVLLIVVTIVFFSVI